MRQFTFIDLFAGCGGLSEGFLKTGKFKALAHVEWELPMVKTLRNRLVHKWNHSDADAKKRVVHFDLQKGKELINGDWSEESKQKYSSTNHKETVEGGLESIVGKDAVDIIIGGPPCQAYSIAGRAQDKDSMKNDYRNYLFESFVEIVDKYRPKVFVFENVPGMLSAKPGNMKVTDRIFEAFSSIGYSIKNPNEMKSIIYNSENFGVAQKRRRVILIGTDSSTLSSPNKIYSAIDKGLNRISKKTLRDAIGNNQYPNIIPINKEKQKNGKRESHAIVSNQKEKWYQLQHIPRFHNERDIKIFKEWIEKKKNSLSTLKKISYYKQKTGRVSKHAKYRSLDWSKPSPTIVAHLYKDGLMFIHPDPKQARSLTIREAAKIQTFDDDFEFIGGMGDCYKMIGNAVPVEMSAKIAESIYTLFISNYNNLS